MKIYYQLPLSARGVATRALPKKPLLHLALEGTGGQTTLCGRVLNEHWVHLPANPESLDAALICRACGKKLKIKNPII